MNSENQQAQQPMVAAQPPPGQYNTPPPYDYDDEIDLKELFMALWAGKWWVVATTLIASAMAVAFALSMPNIYRSEALLAPVGGQQGGLGGLSSRLGGLASLAGVSIPGGGGDKTTTGIQVLQSRQFFADFASKHNVLVPLMAAKGWDASSNHLIIDSKLYDTSTKTWVRDVKPPKQPEPTIQEAHRAFSELLSVTTDKESGFVTIAIEHYSPYVAQEWVGILVQAINETMRQQDVKQAEASIAYLQEQVENTRLAELQAGFFEMIQQQTETVMLAYASDEYLFKTLDPAVVPELKAKPKRALICAVGTVLGFMLGIFIVLIRNGLKKAEGAN